MSRPRNKRLISTPPVMDGFRPFGVPIRDLEPLALLLEEYEAIRLCDYDGFTQSEAAIKMDISRPTFTRIYEKARQTIAQAFVEGKAIFIEGGDYRTENYWYKCVECLKVNISENKIYTCSYCHSGSLRMLNRIIEK